MLPLASSPAPFGHQSKDVVPSGQFNTQIPQRPQTRKIVIKNLKVTPDWVPAEYFLQTTRRLEKAVSTILVGESPGESLEELYRGVENLVRENKGSELYEMLENNCRSHVSKILKQKVDKGITGSIGVGGDGGTAAVECIQSAWEEWTSKIVRDCVTNFDNRRSLGVFSIILTVLMFSRIQSCRLSCTSLIRMVLIAATWVTDSFASISLEPARH
jgi:hypothetical protein